MSEKRFKYIAFDGFEDYGEFITPHQVVDLLNDLYDENMELKSKSKIIYERDAYKRLYDDLKEENKQLKQYKEAIWNCDSSKIIRVNKNTGEVDLVDKEVEE